MRDPASKFFHCSDRERAIFEAGVKLGTVYHQYIGAPLNLTNVESLEKAIEESISVQPFVESAIVKIDKKMINKHKGLYKYITLTGNMLDVSLRVKYKNEEINARLRYIPEMDYPLMYVED
ncbi:MAG: dihydroneopterin aldolase family protein [Candidatus Thermoplasmatota archaeon]|jgi:hypothetical protein|nr:dihydroneopterin aldolase family protein [Candidatus Thermoplasmatota archaeon]MCL5990013.1 dihydroneopterin aldolase family protein [Candidatus Thermoplasmatota archaeon]